ncbi:MAG: tRNA-binding protein [Gammaproteobacteria bacterium]|nr:tRNA-binding protein [Gammaproteobacteria bacterium]MCY4219110.1 tRNA-binding protein [Gammaproteobacteria bacterium]
MEIIKLEDFRKIHIHTGTILSVKLNEKARVPAWVLEIDFGKDFGVKTTSAQLTELYSSENLIGTQVIAVMNFPSLRIAGVKSEVLVLGVLDPKGVVLLRPDEKVENGTRVA